jgi:hypothetical protein
MEVENGVYRHYRGNDYEVLGTAQHSDTLEEMVVYKALYGDNQLWVRPLHVFLEQVVHEGAKKSRFQKIA